MRKSFTLISFRERAKQNRISFRRFLTRLKKDPPGGLDQKTELAEREVWKEVDCMKCANCCKVMTPTYTEKDIRRIARFLGKTVQQVKSSWLKKERGEDTWVNKSVPCQFLDLKTNHCTIYEVRPADCEGFPHLSKKKMVDYIHVHHQNLDDCPATFRMVEKMREMIGVERGKSNR